MLSLLSLLTVQVAGAACPADAGIVEAHLQRVGAAEQAVDWDAFELAVDALRADLFCCCDALTPEQLIRVHRSFALAASRRRDEPRAEAAYRAVLVLEPGFEPPYSDAPPGSLLRRAWKRALEARPEPIRLVPAGAWLVDGQPRTRALPAERAALVQRLGEGESCESWYLEGPWPPGQQDFLLEQPAEGRLAQLPGSVELRGWATRYQCASPDRGWWAPGLAMVAVGLVGVTSGELLENRMLGIDDEQRARRLYQGAVATTFAGWTVGLGGAGLAVGSVLQACEPVAGP
jgi:hypothetical protein